MRDAIARDIHYDHREFVAPRFRGSSRGFVSDRDGRRPSHRPTRRCCCTNRASAVVRRASPAKSTREWTLHRPRRPVPAPGDHPRSCRSSPDLAQAVFRHTQLGRDTGERTRHGLLDLWLHRLAQLPTHLVGSAPDDDQRNPHILIGHPRAHRVRIGLRTCEERVAFRRRLIGTNDFTGLVLCRNGRHPGACDDGAADQIIILMVHPESVTCVDVTPH